MATKNTTGAKRTAKTTKPVDESSAIIADATVDDTKDELKVIAEEPRVFEPTDYVTIRNGFNGTLVYISKRTGEEYIWPEFGSEQDIEIQELKNAKNTAKGFFENNWFLIDDVDVIRFLGVERYYQNALDFDSFDEIFTMSPSQIAERISKLSDGQRESVRYRARQLIQDGVIDSRKVVSALEASLGVKLIEH